MHAPFRSEVLGDVPAWCVTGGWGGLCAMTMCQQRRKSICRNVPVESGKSISGVEQPASAIPTALFLVLTFSGRDSADWVPQDMRVLGYLGFDVKKSPTAQKQRLVRTEPTFFPLLSA